MQRVLLERSQRQAWSKQTKSVGTHWVLAEAGHDYRPQLLLRLELLLLLQCHHIAGKQSHGQSKEYVQIATNQRQDTVSVWPSEIPQMIRLKLEN